MSSIIILVIVLYFTCPCLCHTYSPGNCPSVEPIHDFDMTKFLGRWYAIQKTHTRSSCLVYNFKKGKRSGEYLLEQTSKRYPSGLNVSYAFDYTGKIKTRKNSSTMSIHFPLSVAGRASFDVVTTDYKTFAGIYTCQNILFFKRQSATFLSRTNTLDSSILNKMRHIFDEEDLYDLHLNRIRHDYCDEATSQILLTVKSNLASSINFSQLVSTEKKINRRIDVVPHEVEQFAPVEPVSVETESVEPSTVEPASVEPPTVEPASDKHNDSDEIDETSIEPR